MRTVWRALGVVAGVAGLTGTVLCLAGVVACWVVRGEAVARTDRAFGRATERVDAARADLSRASDTLARTREELAARRPQVGEATAGRLGEVRQVVARATDAALVVDGFLAAVRELPGADRFEDTTAELRDSVARIAELGETATRVLDAGRPAPPDGGEVGDRLPRPFDDALARVSAALATGNERLGVTRDRLAALNARLDRAFTTAAVVVTGLLVWVGAGQASLLVHGFGIARSRSRRLPEGGPHGV